MSKKARIILAILGILILGIYSGYYLYTTYYLPSTITLSPPLENVDFPIEQAQYPMDWPDELIFPNEFMLVDFSSGKLPESTTQGWAAKFRYPDNSSIAEKEISSFLDEAGWTIVEKNKIGPKGYSLLIQREQGSGIIIIDTDLNKNPQTLIIATFFP